MKMPGSKGVLTIKGEAKEALAVLKLALKTAAAAQPTGMGASRAKGAAPTKKKQLFTQDKAETKQVPVDEDGSSGATFTIGANLDPSQEEALVKFLRANKDIFAWEPNQLVGVSREVIQHHLKVCPNVRPMKQRARRQSTEKQAFIVQETCKLEAAGAIREVRYPEWLANPVGVPKKGGRSACVSTSPTSTRPTLRIHSHSLASTRSSIPPPSATCCASWMPS